MRSKVSWRLDLVLCLALLTGACSADSPPIEEIAKPLLASAGCGQTPALDNGQSSGFSFRVGDLDRE